MVDNLNLLGDYIFKRIQKDNIDYRNIIIPYKSDNPVQISEFNSMYDCL